ncbi:MAG: rRNA maturation RNase YbeY [Verrucomicrobiota bacterium]
MNPPSLEISNQYKALESPESATIELFETLIHSNRFPIGSGELSIVFVDDATIARVHEDFMNDPEPTDVITFPADEAMESAGEIIVSVDHAKTRSTELGEPFSRELMLYLIHGWMHLVGYDDRNEEDRSKMRAAENEAFALVDAQRSTIQYLLKE